MANDKRRFIKIYSKTIIEDETPDVGDVIKIEGISYPFGLHVKTSDAGATAPTGALSIQCQVQRAIAKGHNFANISAFANAAITGTDDQQAHRVHIAATGAEAFPQFIRASVTATAATAWNDGTVVEIWISGEAR